MICFQKTLIGFCCFFDCSINCGIRVGDYQNGTVLLLQLINDLPDNFRFASPRRSPDICNIIGQSRNNSCFLIIVIFSTYTKFLYIIGLYLFARINSLIIKRKHSFPCRISF